MPPPKEPLLPRAPTTTDAAPVENLTLQRLDTSCTGLEALEAEQVSDMKEMKRLLLLIRPERTDVTPELPLHVQEEIMKRLPIKSLIRFRCVSKSWKSLIDSSRFIAAHSVFRHNQPQHLLIWYRNRHGDKYVAFVDDDSFPHQRFVPTLPCSLGSPRVVGSSYGLLCLEGVDATHQAGENYGERIVVIWNPSLGKSIAIDVPKRLDENHKEMKVSGIIGFGVCPVTIDPKIVHITQPCPWSNGRKQQFGNFWKVNVYKLSSGNFRNLSSSSNNLPSVSIQVDVEDSSPQVVIDRFIYWCAVVVDGKALQTRSNLIMSFDITDEIFKVVDLPDNLARHTRPGKLSISKLRESLVMLEYNKEHVSCGVWKMTDQRLFTKLFTIKAWCEEAIWALGFRKRGGPLMEVIDSTVGRSSGQLVLYEPITEHCNDDLIIWGDAEAITFVDSYMETLLLFDRSDNCTSY